MIRKNIHKIIFSVLLLMAFSISSEAQYASEEELKTAANKMFEEENYVGSIKLFSQLLSTYPKDPSYNYKYGACLLFGARDKEDALRYLKFSVTKPSVDPIAFYFLAKAYHHNYQFSAAITNYNKYKGKSSVKEHQKYELDRQVTMCKNGLQLIKSMTDIGVLSKKEIKATDFFRSYNLNGIGGKIIVKPDDFRSKLDKKMNESSVIYLGEKKEMVVYSSYGKSETTGKDIYRVVKLPNGDWSKPVTIGDEINTEFDEDYPFLHPDGRTLYFSSKGYNSMGGYDIFKSTMGQDGKWSYPENLDFPINTPDDDILYISDIDNELAYFASSRASKQGELTVYNVTVDASPVENSVIKGFFLAESNPNMKSATITVKDAEKDRRYGVYKTHNLSGEYILTFPKNGGKFKILVETTKDAPVHSAIIELPRLDGFRALKQELRLVGEGDDEKLVVKNLFDETDEFDINDPLFVQNIIKERAKLDVNTTKEELDNTLANSLENAIDNQESSSSTQEDPLSTYSKLSDNQIVNKTDEMASKILSQAKGSKVQANTSYQLANKKSALAKALYNESNTLKANGNLKQARVKKMEAAKLTNEVVAALLIAKTLDNEVAERESDVAKVASLQELVNTNINNGSRAKAESNLEELEEIASATYHTESALDVEGDLVESKLVEKQIQYNKDRDGVTEIQNREYELEETINKLELKTEATKKKKEKAVIEARIEVLKIDVEDTKFDLELAKKKSEKSTKDYNKIKNEADATKNVIAAVNSGDGNSSSVKDISKIQLENDITYFEKEGLVGLYPSTDDETSVENSAVYSLEDHKNEYNVIDDSGEIVDYNSTYNSELTDIDNAETPEERARQIIKINESWIKDINEEITIRTKQSGTVKGVNKVNFEDKIISLKVLKSEKQNEISTNSEILASTNTSSVISENIIEDNNSSTTVTSTNIVEDVNIMNTDGTIIDYESKYTKELEAFTEEEDDYDSYSKKAAIHNNWANAAEQEVLIKKMELIEANEGDKDGIKNEIAVLENNLSEQQEFAELYEYQAESMKESTNGIEEPIANGEEAITNSESIISDDGYKVKYADELESIGVENSYENFIEKATVHKRWSKAIEDEIAIKEVALSTANEEDGNTLKNEIAVLENDFMDQGEFVTLYESQAKAMKDSDTVIDDVLVVDEIAKEVIEETTVTNETIEEDLTVNNLAASEDEFSNLKYNNRFNYKSAGSESTLNQIAVLKEEARALKVESDVKMNTANNTNEEEEKNRINEESIALAKKSFRKQEEISRIYETTNRNEYKNNQSVIENLKKQATDPYAKEIIMAEMLEEESDNYFEEAKDERLNAINTTNKELKEVALQNAYELEMKAIEKQKTAITQLSAGSAEDVYANVEESTVTNEQSETTTESVENTAIEIEATAPSNNEITQEDQETLLSLQPDEIVAIKTTEAYKNYAALKAEKRRLVKEAEVEYFESQKLGAEVTDQKQLEISLKAMAAGAATEEDKAKKLAQLEKLSSMMAKNKAKSAALKSSAESKEIKAKEVSDKSDFILINADENDAGNYAVIEKIETFDNDFMAEVMSGTSIPESTDGQLTSNEETETATDNSVANNNAEEVIAEETVSEGPSTSNEDTIGNNELIIANDDYASKHTGKLAELDGEDSYERFVKKAEVHYEWAKDTENEIAAKKAALTTANETDKNDIENEIAVLENTLSEQQEFAALYESQAETMKPEITTEESLTNNNDTEVVEELTTTLEEPTVNNEQANNLGAAEEVITNSSSNSNSLDEIPDVLNNSIFVMNNNQAAYNDNKRIPLSPKMPGGLVFKVQVGAFRKPIPQEHFKGFSPIMAEDAGNGITRYTAGLFKTFKVANEAKKSIRDIGYSDAFVVGFYNGKRIGMNEARAMLAETNPDEGNLAANNTSNSETNNNTTPAATTENTTNIFNATEEVKDGVSTDVRNIEGIFYAIQVGVYSKPVNAGQLNNVSPLNSERTASGLIRYTSGVYKTLVEANIAKDRIRGLGITDAFVVAYSGGTKTTIAAATKLLSTNTAVNPAKEIPVSENTNDNNEVINETKAINETTEIDEVPSAEDEVIVPIEENLAPEKVVENDDPDYEPKEGLNLEFRVKLGEYEEDVPVEDAGMFLKLTGRGMKNYEKGDKTVYTIGAFPDYESALDLQIEMKEMGVQNSEIIVFRDGVEMSLEEALELMKSNQ